jgi:hypothetical protein
VRASASASRQPAASGGARAETSSQRPHIAGSALLSGGSRRSGRSVTGAPNRSAPPARSRPGTSRRPALACSPVDRRRIIAARPIGAASATFDRARRGGRLRLARGRRRRSIVAPPGRPAPPARSRPSASYWLPAPSSRRSRWRSQHRRPAGSPAPAARSRPGCVCPACTGSAIRLGPPRRRLLRAAGLCDQSRRSQSSNKLGSGPTPPETGAQPTRPVPAASVSVRRAPMGAGPTPPATDRITSVAPAPDEFKPRRSASSAVTAPPGLGITRPIA